uniref:HD domain-containing protein n=1 Tax=Noctiluca scintillans TaxID=2966 RepID=A0A7S1B0C6_NOCSC|mmetsp:Transcript_7716/g.21066  ORF Transcript_7716/g.21066 Transcript_7716/m.21066 type:complete len:248 (+) Transcript_7716:57-800(+)
MDSLSFITDICGALKKIKRTGWVMRQIPLPESDADHMHRCAMCAMLLSQPPDPRDDYSTPDTDKFHPQKVNQARLLRMAVTHDVCEALAGDITPFCDPSVVASKHDKEDQAMQAIKQVVGDLLGQELYSLWAEYEAGETIEALYCKDIDKFEMVVQAFEYEKEHLKPLQVGDATADTVAKSHGTTVPPVFDEPLRRFFITTNAVIKSPLFRRLDVELRQRRETMLKERGWTVTAEERQKSRKRSLTE